MRKRMVRDGGDSCRSNPLWSFRTATRGTNPPTTTEGPPPPILPEGVGSTRREIRPSARAFRSFSNDILPIRPRKSMYVVASVSPPHWRSPSRLCCT
ncbi:hypothetical protein CRG98_043377 [Punica granatum]|uniref:Uncharacterized protein n=1 Tax=Punica granatum TaxID=22663 RepID=A0A2I0HX01_PUNGR|nr:hypothetical protein CRG98_043377 [Punica granatum]